MKTVIDRGYVAAKQMTGLWAFVTRIERKFYHTGTFRIAEANALVNSGRFAEADAVLRRSLPNYLRPAASVIRANMRVGDSVDWLMHLNAYLAIRGQAPVRLIAGGTRLEQLSSDTLPSVNNGPLITVIMTTHNAAKTVTVAIGSILNQTWKNIELVVVDDASNDDTPAILARIAQQDPRVRILRHDINAGPYVCKNVVLHKQFVKGEFITCHDADDWAHPQRLEMHMRDAKNCGAFESASLAYCLRMKADGKFSRIGEPRSTSPDGVAQVARVSCLFARQFLISQLGSWDCTKFGADSEIVDRAEYLLGRRLTRSKGIGMICLDTAASLSSHEEFGVSADRQLSPVRRSYKNAYEKWHARNGKNAKMPFPPTQKPFERPSVMDVPLDVINALLD